MKEIKIGAWIYRNKKIRKGSVAHTIRIPNDIRLSKGIYIIKISKLDDDL